MPYDRRSGRVLLATMGLVGVAMSIGCMRASTLRSSAGAVPELTPAGELHPVAGESVPAAAAPATVTPATSWARTPSPTPTPTRTAVEPVANPEDTAASASQGAGAPAASPATGGTDPADAPASGTPSSSLPAPAGERPAPTTSSPTPLLDAEIRRAEAVTRQHIESLKAAETPTPLHPVETPTDRPDSASVLAPVPAEAPKAEDPGPDVGAAPPLATIPRIADGPEAAGSSGGIVVPPLIPIEAPAAGLDPEFSGTLPLTRTAADPPPRPDPGVAIADLRDGRQAEDSKETQAETIATADPRGDDRPTGKVAPAPEVPGAGANREEHPPLEISALRLCSRVKEFGSVEPVDPDAMKPGQRVRVYFEMTGLEYQAIGDAFVSRLVAHLELRSGADGPVVWEQSLATARDLCHRPRRDYYASFLVEFPKTLEPGPYRLRLIQTDLVGNRTAAREIPVTIVR